MTDIAVLAAEPHDVHALLRDSVRAFAQAIAALGVGDCIVRVDVTVHGRSRHYFELPRLVREHWPRPPHFACHAIWTHAPDPGSASISFVAYDGEAKALARLVVDTRP